MTHIDLFMAAYKIRLRQKKYKFLNKNTDISNEVHKNINKVTHRNVFMVSPEQFSTG